MQIGIRNKLAQNAFLPSSSSPGVWSRYSSSLRRTRSSCGLARIYMNFNFNFVKSEHYVLCISKGTILSNYTREQESRFLKMIALVAGCTTCSARGVLSPLDTTHSSAPHLSSPMMMIAFIITLRELCSNCVWNSVVLSYLASHSEWRCLRCLSFYRC